MKRKSFLSTFSRQNGSCCIVTLQLCSTVPQAFKIFWQINTVWFSFARQDWCSYLCLEGCLSILLKIILEPWFYVTRIKDCSNFLDVKKQLDFGFVEHILKQLLSGVFETPRDTISASAVYKCPIVQSCFVGSTLITERNIFNVCVVM